MGVLICLRECGLVGMGAMFGGDVIQSRFFRVLRTGCRRGVGVRIPHVSNVRNSLVVRALVRKRRESFGASCV